MKKLTKNLRAESILIPFIIFSFLFGIVYVLLTTRNKERLALIKKGVDTKLFNSDKKYGFCQVVLNLALLAIGVGLGVLIGALLNQSGLEEGVAFTSSFFIFGGIGLFISFFLNRKFQNEES